MPSGTWGNYSQEGNITKFRDWMELLMEMECRPVVMKRMTRAPGVEAPGEEGSDAGVAPWRRAATLGSKAPLLLLIPWRWCWCR